MISVLQEHGSVRNYAVEQSSRRCASSKRIHGPAATGNPIKFGVRPRIFTNCGEGLFCGATGGEIAAQHFDASGDRMHVGILESGQKKSTTEINHRRGTALERGHVFRVHRQDLAVGYGKTTPAGHSFVTGIDPAVGENGVNACETVVACSALHPLTIAAAIAVTPSRRLKV